MAVPKEATALCVKRAAAHAGGEPLKQREGVRAWAQRLPRRGAELSSKTEEGTSATESLHRGYPVSKPPFCCTALRSVLTRAFVKPFLSSCPPTQLSKAVGGHEDKKGLTKARVKTERSAAQQKGGLAWRWDNHGANFRSQTCALRFWGRAERSELRQLT